MAQRSTTRDVGPLAFRAMFAPATLDKDKRTVQVTWTTGARVQRGGFFTEPFLEELSLDPKHVRMGRLQSGRAPLLDSHNAERIADSLGVVRDAQIDTDGARGSATVRFDSGAGGSDAMRRVEEGTLTDISVGYRIHKMKKMPDDEASKMPVYRAVDWEPHELSLTPLGADADSYARSEPAQRNACEIITEERTMDPVPEPTNPPASPAATAAPAAPVQTADQIRSDERERIAVIMRTARALGRPQAEADAAIAAGTKIKHYQRAAIDARAEAAPEAGGPIAFDRSHPRIQAGEDQRDKWLRGSEAWLIQRAGLSSLMAKYAKTDLARQLGHAVIDLDPGEFRGLRLIDLARSALDHAGMATRGMLGQDLVGHAFTYRSATQSTGDFPILLENVLYKVLLAQYATTPDTWRRFCMVGSVTDFRPTKRYRMGTLGNLSALNELGEFTNKVIPDAERQSVSAGTKGNILGLSRQGIINDDMGAFSQVATMFGRAAALSIELDTYALLALNGGLGPALSDGNTMFHATHNNITTGAAIGSTAIDLDRVAMKVQKDVSGNELLDLVPAILVIPATLGGVARQINTSQYDFDAISSKNPWVPNKVSNLFADIVDTGRITGTRRYLFADPGSAPMIEVVFLDGQQQPFMDMQQGWRTDGVEWKVRIDYGVNGVDFRGGVTNAGV